MKRSAENDWWATPAKPKRHVDYRPSCPWCDSYDIEAEFVDVGFGGGYNNGIQVTAYVCPTCGASQMNPHDRDKTNASMGEKVLEWFGPHPHALWEGALDCPSDGCMSTRVCDLCKSRLGTLRNEA